MAIEGVSPAHNYSRSFKSAMDSTTYTLQLDRNLMAMERLAANFAPLTMPDAFGRNMQMIVGPGHFFNGTGLVELGGRGTLSTTATSASATAVSNVTGLSVGQAILVYTYAAVQFTGNTTNGSDTISSVSSLVNLYVGQPMYGPGIAPGSTILTFPSGSSVQLSKPCQSTITAATFYSAGMVPICPVGTIIKAISGTTLTLSNNATISATGAFFVAGQPIGTITTGSTTNGSNVVTTIPDTKGAFVGMAITGSGIPTNTTVSGIVDANTIQLSANASATASGVVLTITVPIPGGSPRIDLICISQVTGLANWVIGTPGVSPAAPTLPSNYLPVCLVALASSNTAIGPSDLGDIRDLSAMGLKSGAFSVQVNVPAIAVGLSAGMCL